MSTSSLTPSFSNHLVLQIQESISEESNSIYYIFASRAEPFTGSDSVAPAVETSFRAKEIDTYTKMLFGKRVLGTDLIPSIDKRMWTANTIYQMYDDQSSNTDFYVAVDAGSNKHIFKCLSNNNGLPSTVEPDFSSATQDLDLYDSADDYYKTSDGYRWKYMYSVPSATWQKFSTQNTMPVVANSDVRGKASYGAIDVINIDSAGSGYSSYIVSGQFSSDDLNVTSNSVFLTGISQSVLYAASNTASSNNGFYSGSILKITGGTGSGQWKEIFDYINDGSKKILRLTTPFDVLPDSTSTYDIYPKVIIVGDSNQTVNATARALVNSNSNSIYDIEMLNPGRGYIKASASVYTPNTISVSNTAVLRPIISPKNGHGFDSAVELGCNKLCISVEFANTESNTINASNDFRQVGILKDPVFRAMTIETKKLSDGNAGIDGTFLEGEEIRVFTQSLLNGTVSINTTSTTLVGSNTDFANSVSISDKLLIIANTQLSIQTISSVTNATHLTMSSNGLFQNSSCSVYKINIGSGGIVSNTSSNTVGISNVSPIIHQNESLIGLTSLARANASNILIRGVNRNEGLMTFNQLTEVHGSRTGTFVADEKVYRGSLSEANAVFISGNSSVMFINDTSGTISTGQTLVGANSGATFLITNKYESDIIPLSGEILYFQNNLPVTRSNTQTESIKFVLEF